MHLDMHRAKRCGARTRRGKPCSCQRWQTVGAECTVVPHREHQRAIGMRSSTGDTAEAIANRRHLSAMLATMKALAAEVTE
jgi:hypothetical protein